MSEKKPKAPKTEVEDTETTPELTHVSLSIVKRNVGLYDVVRILFDHESRSVGQIEILKEGVSRSEAEEIYKVTTAREIFMRFQ